MTSAFWIRLCSSFYFSFYVLASAFVISYDGQQPITVPPTKEQSFLGTTPDNAVDGCPRLNPNVTDGSLIGQLWQRNCDLVEKFLNNKFSVFQATDGTNASVPSFQYYSVQDYYYLVETVQHKAFLMATWPPSKPLLAARINETVQSMKKGLKDASDFRTSLTKLHVPNSVIDNGTLHAAGLGYVKWLQENTNLGWAEFRISQIACVYGWAELANQLDKLPNRKNDTLFYSQWIQPNLDWTYGAKMSKEFDEKLPFDNKSETFLVYERLFRQGLRFEIALFESSIGKSLNDTM